MVGISLPMIHDVSTVRVYVPLELRHPMLRNEVPGRLAVLLLRSSIVALEHTHTRVHSHRTVVRVGSESEGSLPGRVSSLSLSLSLSLFLSFSFFLFLFRFLFLSFSSSFSLSLPLSFSLFLSFYLSPPLTPSRDESLKPQSYHVPRPAPAPCPCWTPRS